MYNTLYKHYTNLCVHNFSFRQFLAKVLNLIQLNTKKNKYECSSYKLQVASRVYKPLLFK